MELNIYSTYNKTCRKLDCVLYLKIFTGLVSNTAKGHTFNLFLLVLFFFDFLVYLNIPTTGSSRHRSFTSVVSTSKKIRFEPNPKLHTIKMLIANEMKTFNPKRAPLRICFNEALKIQYAKGFTNEFSEQDVAAILKKAYPSANARKRIATSVSLFIQWWCKKRPSQQPPIIKSEPDNSDNETISSESSHESRPHPTPPRTKLSKRSFQTEHPRKRPRVVEELDEVFQESVRRMREIIDQNNERDTLNTCTISPRMQHRV